MRLLTTKMENIKTFCVSYIFLCSFFLLLSGVVEVLDSFLDIINPKVLIISMLSIVGVIAFIFTIKIRKTDDYLQEYYF